MTVAPIPFVERLSHNERFDPATNAWEAMPPMATKRSAFGAAVLDGKLIVVGGYDGSQCLNSAERFNLATGSWEALLSNLSEFKFKFLVVLGFLLIQS